jgi:hypothetical protein
VAGFPVPALATGVAADTFAIREATAALAVARARDSGDLEVLGGARPTTGSPVGAFGSAL